LLAYVPVAWAWQGWGSSDESNTAGGGGAAMVWLCIEEQGCIADYKMYTQCRN